MCAKERASLVTRSGDESGPPVRSMASASSSSSTCRARFVLISTSQTCSEMGGALCYVTGGQGHMTCQSFFWSCRQQHPQHQEQNDAGP